MKEVIKQLKNSKRVAIIAHISPDPDCISSMTALSCILEQMGKQTHMFVDCDKIKEFMMYYQLPTNVNDDLIPEQYDTVIAVDLPQLYLMGKYADVMSNHNNIVVIDHHSNRNLLANIVYVDDKKSSCSEIIFDLAKKLKVEITPQIASYIYAGILGDTNCFQNDNVNENTLITAGECVKYGADIVTITYIFQKHQTIQEIQLKAIAYNNIHIENQIGYAVLTKKMFKETKTEDCPSLVNEILNTGDNLFAFVLKQKDKNTYTISFRCKQGYDVSNIAKKFGGGGHVQASGAMVIGSPKKLVKEICIECKKQIGNK